MSAGEHQRRALAARRGSGSSNQGYSTPPQSPVRSRAGSQYYTPQSSPLMGQSSSSATANPFRTSQERYDTLSATNPFRAPHNKPPPPPPFVRGGGGSGSESYYVNRPLKTRPTGPPPAVPLSQASAGFAGQSMWGTAGGESATGSLAYGSGFQQTEPSVRPKVRSQPQLQQQRALPLPLIYTPSPADRTPDIVRRYRSPTGSPDWAAMRAQPYGVTATDPAFRAQELAQQHQMGARTIAAQRSGSAFRKQQILDQRLSRYDPFAHQNLSDTGSLVSGRSYRSSDSDSDDEYEGRALLGAAGGGRRGLQRRPSLGWEGDRLVEARQPVGAANEPEGQIRGMGSRPKSYVMPTGRMGFGQRWDPNRRRSYSMADLSETYAEDRPETYSRREQDFAHRLSTRSEDDIKLYGEMREASDPQYQNRAVSSRLGSGHSRLSLMDADKARLSRIRSRAATNLGQRDRSLRRQHLEADRRLPQAMTYTVRPQGLRVSEDTEPLVAVPERWRHEQDWHDRSREYERLFGELRSRSADRPGVHGVYDEYGPLPPPPTGPLPAPFTPTFTPDIPTTSSSVGTAGAVRPKPRRFRPKKNCDIM